MCNAFLQTHFHTIPLAIYGQSGRRSLGSHACRAGKARPGWRKTTFSYQQNACLPNQASKSKHHNSQTKCFCLPNPKTQGRSTYPSHHAALVRVLPLQLLLAQVRAYHLGLLLHRLAHSLPELLAHSPREVLCRCLVRPVAERNIQRFKNGLTNLFKFTTLPQCHT